MNKTDTGSLVEDYSATLTKLDTLNAELDRFAEHLDKLAGWLKYHRDAVRFIDQGTGKRFEKRDGYSPEYVQFHERTIGTLAEKFVARTETISQRNDLEHKLKEAGLENLIRKKS